MRTKNVSQSFDELRDKEMLEAHRKLNRVLDSGERDTSYWGIGPSRSICAQCLAENQISSTMMNGVDELFGTEAAMLAFQQFRKLYMAGEDEYSILSLIQLDAFMTGTIDSFKYV